MKERFPKLVVVVGAAIGGFVLLLAPGWGQNSKAQVDGGAGAKKAAQGSAPSAAWPSHRPDGQPDVQGYWVAVYYGMSCLKDPSRGVGCFDAQDGPAIPGRVPHPAPSRITDAPDGEVPYTPAAKEHQQYLLKNYFEPTRPEFIDPQQLCLPLGAVRQLTWHDVQILQYDNYVVFEHEGGHVYRIIPLDGRPHAGANIKLWMGDSRGHWEDNTLVVDVANNNSKGRLSRAGDFASDKVHIVEHFKFLDADHLRYEAVFDDPSVYTRKWTFGFDLKRGIFGGPNNQDQSTYEQWEEACYEGSHDIDKWLFSSNGSNPEQIQK